MKTDDLENIGSYNLFTSDEKLEKWHYGEWIEEPDLFIFQYKDYQCEIERKAVGYLCGYVYLYSTDEVEGEFIDVHGGITFDETRNQTRAIGFDCAHSGDILPSLFQNKSVLDLKKKILHLSRKKSPLLQLIEVPIYKNMEFCIEECKKIVNQLITFKKNLTDKT